jgi:hypothetical protein
MQDLLDSDILILEGVMAKLRVSADKTMVPEDFRKEAVERFGEAGFEVDVKVWYTDQIGLFSFDFEIIRKLDDKPFDHERMQHEVTHDLLGLGEGGAIDANGLIRDV